MAGTVLTGVSFLQKGRGKDLLFLHGYLSSKEAFTAQIDYFSRFYRVTAIDFLGFGQSAPLERAFSVEDYADWLLALFPALHLKKPHVIAHSFGVRVAVKAAAKYAGELDKLVLTGPAGVIINRGFKYKMRVKTYRLVKKIAPAFAERKFGSAEYRTLSNIMKESYKKIVNEDLREQAKRVQNQVLIVQGKTDATTTEQEARIYLQSFPNARLAHIDGAHFAFAENPLAFNLLAEEFLYD